MDNLELRNVYVFLSVLTHSLATQLKGRMLESIEDSCPCILHILPSFGS